MSSVRAGSETAKAVAAAAEARTDSAPVDDHDRRYGGCRTSLCGEISTCPPLYGGVSARPRERRSGRCEYTNPAIGV